MRRKRAKALKNVILNSDTSRYLQEKFLKIGGVVDKRKLYKAIKKEYLNKKRFGG